MLGNRIRQARLARDLSLQDVASRAKVSVATLSRIERDKQGLDLGLFLILSKILKATPQELLTDAEAGDPIDPLAVRIAAMQTAERTRLWRELAAQRLNIRRARALRQQRQRQISDEVEELLAQMEFMRGQIESVQRRIRR